MKTVLACLNVALFFFLYLQAAAQPTNERGWYDRKSIEDVEVGWMKVLQFKEPAKPFAQHGWSYTARQTEFTQQAATWMQQTLTPKGMLGEMKLSVLAPAPSAPVTSKSYTYNEAEKNNRKAFPNTYGAYAKFYMHLQKTATKKFWPINGLADYYTWDIMANNIEAISKQWVALSSPDEYYCTMPKYSIGMKGEYDNDWLKEYANYRDFTTSPALKRYEHYLIPSLAIDHTRQTYYVVIMTKDNKPLPFEQVTVGEFINRVEKQLPLMYQAAVNNDTKLNNLMENAQRGLKYIKQQYSNRLNEFVYVSSSSAQIDIVDLYNMEPGRDIYWLKTQAITQENRDYTSTSFPMLRLKKGVKESLATTGPQWIVFRLGKGVDMSSSAEILVMETFINRFNYEYVYNKFFGDNKVIEPYKPLSFVSTEEKNNAQAALPPSEEAKKKAADKSVLYFEDFSTVPSGAVPANWNTQRSQVTGDKVMVTEVDGVKGKWLKLKRTAYPTNINLPLTGDFTFSFDVLVQKGDVPWGTPGIRLELYSGKKPKEASSPHHFSIDVSPGNMNQKDAAGWVMIGKNMPAGYMECKTASYYSIAAFTGSNQVNQVTMAIERKGEKVTVLCNNAKVYECEKAFPGNLSFGSVRFEVNENVYHISNVIVKR